MLTIAQHVIDMTKQHSPVLFACTMGLHRIVENDVDSKRVSTDFVGSGVAVRYNGRTFVVTAHHVVEDCGGPDNVYLAQNEVGGSQDVASFGGQYISPTSNADLDIGRYEIDAIQLQNCSIIPYDVGDRDEDYAFPGGSFYVVGGFPASAVKRRSRRGPFRIGFRTIIALESDTMLSSHPPDSHLVLKYDQKNQAKYMHGESGTRKGVMPAGMSGCGMYRFSLLPNTEGHYVVRLIAIFTDYDKRLRVLIGTRLGPLLRAGMLK